MSLTHYFHLKPSRTIDMCVRKIIIVYIVNYADVEWENMPKICKPIHFALCRICCYKNNIRFRVSAAPSLNYDPFSLRYQIVSKRSAVGSNKFPNNLLSLYGVENLECFATKDTDIITSKCFWRMCNNLNNAFATEIHLGFWSK